jgi:D-beta-D-heptose 7-phosphate kinase/D-beta-D-heptose 1-phosphate adenosyltransferase
LEHIRGRRVAVLGDVLLDEFLWGEATRISPEAPVPVILLERESWSLGGAANVAANVRALGGDVTLFSVIGRDHAGQQVRELLQECGIDDSGLLTESGRPTTVKQRVLARNKHVLRIDREYTAPLSAKEAGRLLRVLEARCDEFDALLVSDYAKGCLTSTVLRGIARLGLTGKFSVCVDPKDRNQRYSGATVIKPNLREMEELTGLTIHDEETLQQAAARVFRRHAPQHLLVTRGKDGMTLFDAAGGRTRIHTAAMQVTDVTGAGDTTLAVLGMGLAAGAEIREAALLANLAAGLVVSKPGTAVVRPDELLESLAAATGSASGGQ